jgi:4-amino-4-deoxy-L-arabinose transferase-like glycosyltransferase
MENRFGLDGHQAGPALDAMLARTSANRRFLAFMLIVAALYALGVNSHWWYVRDSVRYMGLARSWAETGTYAVNGKPSLFALPGFPLMLSVIYSTLGENFLAMNIFMALCGIGSVALTCLLFDRTSLTWREKAAIVLLFGFSRTLYYYSRLVMTDVPFTLAVTAGLYCGVRMLQHERSVKSLWGFGAVAATCVACAIRPLGPVLAAALVAAIWLRHGSLKRWGRNLGWTSVLVGPFVVLAALWAYWSVRSGALLSDSYFYKFIADRGALALSTKMVRSAYALVESLSDTVLGTDLGLAVSIPLLLLIGVGVREGWRRGERLLSAYGLFYSISICISTPNRRLLLPVLPVLLYWLVLGTGAVGRYLAERRGMLTKRRAAQAAGILFFLALAVNGLRVSKLIYLARTPDFYSVDEDGRLKDHFALAEWLRTNTGPDDCVLLFDISVVQYFGRVKISHFSIGQRRYNPRKQLRLIRKDAVTFMVKDNGHPKSAKPMEQLLQAQPRAFRKVRDFGNLELFRVFPHALRQPAMRKRQGNENGEAHRRNGNAGSARP